MISYSEAIISIDSSFLYSCEGETYEGINWQDNRDIPSKAVLDAEIIRLQAEDDAQEYARSRDAEYPSLKDQQDMQFHDAIDGTTTWQDAIQAIKDKYPKPE
jgi:hypothetical protein